MGIFTAMGAVAKHFGPRWFSAIIVEAEQMPATITGLFFMWLVFGATTWFAWSAFSNHAYAADQRAHELTKVVAAMQSTISENTRALNCSRQDRRIAAKNREIDVLDRLIARTVDEHQLRDLKLQRTDLVRELSDLQSVYEGNCLQ